MFDSHHKAQFQADKQESFSEISFDGDVSCSLLSFLEDQNSVSLDLPANRSENDSQHLDSILPPFDVICSDHVVTDDPASEESLQGKSQFSSSAIPRTSSHHFGSEFEEFYMLTDTDTPLAKSETSPLRNTIHSNAKMKLTFHTIGVEKRGIPTPQYSIYDSQHDHIESHAQSESYGCSFERRMKLEMEILRRCSYRTSFSRHGVSKVQKHILKNILKKAPSDMMDSELKLLRLYVSLGLQNARRTKL